MANILLIWEEFAAAITVQPKRHLLSDQHLCPDRHKERQPLSLNN